MSSSIQENITSLRAKAQQLRDQMFGLECGDDFLFTNANGNLPTYRAWERELRDTERQIAELSSASAE